MHSESIINTMLSSDSFSQLLGIEVIEVSSHSVELKILVTKEMTNGFGVAHGGITYSLADSCLAFAINLEGVKSMSIETSISHLKRVGLGDILYAKSKRLSLSKKIGVYQVEILNQKNQLVADFKGTCYRSSEVW